MNIVQRHFLYCAYSALMWCAKTQLWPALMNAVEWNKKAEIAIEQALRHVKAHVSLIARFTKSDRAQVVLMVTMQEHAYKNQTFLKIFSRLCLLFYKGTPTRHLLTSLFAMQEYWP